MDAAFLIVNGQCHNYCKYCFYNIDQCVRNFDSFNNKNIPHLIRFLRLNHVRELVLTGGDCLHKDYFDSTVDLIKKIKILYPISISLISSAPQLNKNNLKKLEGVGLDLMFISIDSIDIEINDFLRGYTKETLNAINFISKSKIRYNGTIVITSKSYKKVRETYNYLKNNGANEVVMQPVFISDIKDKHNLGLKNISKSDFIELFKLIDNLMKKEGKKRYFDLLKQVYIKKKIMPMICFMGNEKIVIKPNGDITNCFHLDKKLGSIFNPIKIEKNKQKCSNFGEHCISIFAEKYYTDKKWKF